MSSRFYCELPLEDGRFQLGEEESRHLSRVMRLGPGDEVEIFDGRGAAWHARVLEASPKRTLLEPITPVEDTPPPLSITLATAVPKGERMDWLIEKATELGVDRVIPILTERAVVDPRQSRLERLRRTVIEACKQSRRNRLMTILPVTTWPQLLAQPGDTLRLLADPEGLPPARWPAIHTHSNTTLAVGPEGGLTHAEKHAALSLGWHPVALGNSILRIETAAIAGCAMILAREELTSA